MIPMAEKMVIDLVNLPEDEKVDITFELDPEKLNLEFDDFHYKSKLKLQGFLEKMSSALVFQGALKTKVEKICSRCLAEIEEDLAEPFDLAFDIKGKLEIDVTEDLRDVMILAHPLRFLCQEDCKGLCAGCGVNLNNESCQCPN